MARGGGGRALRARPRGVRPGPERFQRVLVPAPASGPDGLTIDRHDRRWTGLYYSGGLGRLELASGRFEAFAAPYAGAAMAIPVATRSGALRVSDHAANRISRFDPASSTWSASHVLPTPDSWVVAGAEDTGTDQVFFTEFNAGRLAVVSVGGPPRDFPIPGFGPAFAAVSGGKLYYSQWSVAPLGEYAHPEHGELGGPIGVLPNGDVVVGTRNQGRILVYDAAQKTFESYPIPTVDAGLKDGLAVERSGRIWFTESAADRLVRLEIER